LEKGEDLERRVVLSCTEKKPFRKEIRRLKRKMSDMTGTKKVLRERAKDVHGGQTRGDTGFIQKKETGKISPRRSHREKREEKG